MKCSKTRRRDAAPFLLALVLLSGSCGSSTDSPVHTLEVTPGSTILVGTGDSVTFEARLVDAEGELVSDAPSVTWVSSHPDAVSINAAGEATAMTNVGSALITASTNGLVSAPVLAAVAVPSDNALRLSDDRFVSAPEPVGELPEEISSGFQMRAVISGSPPLVDQLIIATGETSFAGRVVSVNQVAEGSDVIVEFTSMAELFKELSISESIAWAKTAETQAASTKTGNEAASGSQRVLKQGSDPAAEFDIGPFTCQVDVGVSVTDLVFNITPVFDVSQVWTNFIWVIANNETTDFEAIIQGPFSLALDGNIELPVSFTSAIDCRDKAIEVAVIPPSGTLGLLSVEAFATVGIAFEAQASTVAARVLLDGSLTGAGRIGVDYSNLDDALPLVSDVDLENHVNVAFEFDDTLGDSAEVTLKPAIRASLGTQLKVGIFGLSKTYEVAEWIGTAARELKYATVNRQIQNTNFAASETLTLKAQYKITKEAYKAMFAWTVSGPYAIEAIDTLIDIAGAFGVSIDLNNYTLLTLNSPTGTLTAPASVEEGQEIDFAVTLQDVDDFDGYNIEEVRLYKHEGSGVSLTSQLLGVITPNEGDTNLVYTWTPGGGDVGDHRVSAFVITKESPATLYEIAANSQVPVTVTPTASMTSIELVAVHTKRECLIELKEYTGLVLHEESDSSEMHYFASTAPPPIDGTESCSYSENPDGELGRPGASVDSQMSFSASSGPLSAVVQMQGNAMISVVGQSRSGLDWGYVRGRFSTIHEWRVTLSEAHAYTLSVSANGGGTIGVDYDENDPMDYYIVDWDTLAESTIPGQQLVDNDPPEPTDVTMGSGVLPGGTHIVRMEMRWDPHGISTNAEMISGSPSGSAMVSLELTPM